MNVSDAPEEEEKAPLDRKCKNCDVIRKYEDCELGCMLVEKRKESA